MTANELADGLDKIWDNDYRHPIVLKASVMLRQQAEEIEELKKELEKSVTNGIHKNLMSLYDKKASEK